MNTQEEIIKESKDDKFPVSIDCSVKIYAEKTAPLMHINKHLRLLYFVYTGALIKINSKEFDIKAGEIAMLPPGSLYSIRTKNAQAMYHSIIIERQFCESLDFKIDEFGILKPINDTEIKNYFEQMVLDYKLCGNFYKIKVLSEALLLLKRLYELSLYGCENSMTAAEAGKIKIIKNAIKYIEQNFDKSILVEDLSVVAETEKTYFGRVFKEITKTTPIEYINIYRCKMAEYMLEVKDKSVSEVAQLCGFANSSYFTRTYKKYIGSLPSKTM
ncbi:MAG: helix-turn-helix transcriptional regulator [Clostridia bacterium]|nr:helix-turn-helix transcriptional regulator [Clostridia bacterium]